VFAAAYRYTAAVAAGANPAMLTVLVCGVAVLLIIISVSTPSALRWAAYTAIVD
jgi:hypothetical protein